VRILAIIASVLTMVFMVVIIGTLAIAAGFRTIDEEKQWRNSKNLKDSSKR